MSRKKILMIDDDIYIGNLVEEALGREGYQVSRAYSGTEALLFLSGNRPDLILLDLMLPGLSGEEVLPQIREIPVIVVSAKVDVDDKVKLLLGGAVDYLTKPFQMKELLARISVHLREPLRESLRERADGAPHRLEYGGLLLDTETHCAMGGGCEVKLTRTEFAILKLLMQNPGQVIPKSRLLDRISEDTPDCTESSLKMHVSNLRKKLSQAGHKDFIEAVWGIGFRLR